MIQDIYPHKFYNQYNPSVEARAEDIVLSISDGELLLHKDMLGKNIIAFPKKKDYPNEQNVTFLFCIDEKRYFLINKRLPESEIPSAFTYVKERSLRIEGIEPFEEVFAATTAKHLSDWYRDNTFCGRCGKPMMHSAKERAMICECGYTSYPRIMPAVIVGVTNGDKILLTKYKTGFAYNALVAGFTEIGETVEETVAREVMEETGLRVKNIRYYKSQPWGTANDILLGFYCDVDGDDTITMDQEELRYAEWVQREDIELQPGNFSLTNEMMRMFKENKSN